MKLVFFFLLFTLYISADGKTFENIKLGKEDILTENILTYNADLLLPIWESAGGYFFIVGDTTHLKKPLKIWVFTKDNRMIKGLLTASSDSILFIDQSNDNSVQPVNITFDKINEIKIRKKGSTLKGLGIGAGIGIIPVFFGEGGAYVAVATLPIGIITGGIIGATSKKKYIINGNAESFARFVDKISR